MSTLGWDRCSTFSQYQAALLGLTPMHAVAAVGDYRILEMLWDFGAESKYNHLGMPLGEYVIQYIDLEEKVISISITLYSAIV